MAKETGLVVGVQYENNSTCSVTQSATLSLTATYASLRANSLSNCHTKTLQ